jgi:hypothetical protein
MCYSVVQSQGLRRAGELAKSDLVQLVPFPALDRRTSSRMILRLLQSFSTNTCVRRYFPPFGSRTIGPLPQSSWIDCKYHGI